MPEDLKLRVYSGKELVAELKLLGPEPDWQKIENTEKIIEN